MEPFFIPYIQLFDWSRFFLSPGPAENGGDFFFGNAPWQRTGQKSVGSYCPRGCEAIEDSPITALRNVWSKRGADGKNVKGRSQLAHGPACGLKSV